MRQKLQVTINQFAAIVTLLAITLCSSNGLFGQTEEATESAALSVEEVAEQAIEYLKTQGQNPDDGSFSSFAGPAVTALVTTGMIRHGVPLDDPAVAKALTYLEGFKQDDGGIYETDSLYKNYETSLAILCFVEANVNGDYDALIKGAVKFTNSTQWGGEGRAVEESDDRFGGMGYGKHERPDLSNTSYGIDALVAAGVDPDSEVMQRALKFVSRSQNLESAHNDTPMASKNPDGGFFYTPAGGGESKVEDLTATGGLRSYGSMTYAGLKSMLYAGVEKDDIRVRAATDWIRMNYDLDHNPGMGPEGLFYYYHVFAKTLDAIGEETFIDDQDVTHEWRQELLAKLASLQADDGSFINKESERWMESDPNLVTGYVLLALSYCEKEEE